MSNSPVTLVANCPDPIARSTAYGNLPITFTGPVRYYPTPESRWNLCRNTWHSGHVNQWVDAGTGTISYEPSLPSGGGTGAKFVISSVAGARMHSTNAGIAAMWRYRNMGEQHTFSVEVYHAAGAGRSVSFQIQDIGGPGGLTVNSSNISVPSGVWTTVQYTMTPTRKRVFLWVINFNSGQGWVNGDTLYFRNPMIEPGVTTRGSYFDSTNGGGNPVICWDQRTYFAKATSEIGVAITNPGWLQERWSPNMVTNPFGEVNTTGRTFTNCSGARTQDYAIQGAWSVRLTATGANATDSFGSITVYPLAADAVLHAIVTNETASARTCEWTVDGVSVPGSSQSVAAYQQADIRGYASVTGGAHTYAIRWTNSANTETFITQYAYVGLTQFTYSSGAGPLSLTPTIDDLGNIMTGWSWTGTAHASSSLTVTPALNVPVIPHLTSQQGAMIARSVRKASWRQAASPDFTRPIVTAGTQFSSDMVRLNAGEINTQGFALSLGNSTASTITSSTGQLVDTTEDLAIQWSDDQFSVHSIGLWDRIGTRKSNLPSGVLTGTVEAGGSVCPVLIRSLALATRMLTDAERNQIHNTAGNWNLDVIDNLQPDNSIIKPRANYNGPVPDASVGAGLTDVLISAQGGHMWRTFNAWNLAASWVINDHGTLACAVEMDDVSAYCTTAQALQGRDIRWNHPTAGWWRGVITAVVPRPDDRTVEITAKGYSWWLSKRVTPKIAKFPGAPPGGIISAVLQASKREATLPFDSIQIDETGAPFAYETRAGNVLDVVRGVTSRSGQEWQNDMDANQFQWRQELGRDLSAQIQLVDNIHIVDHRPEFSLDAKANALLVQPTDDRYKARNSFFAEDGASIDAYGRLEDGRTYAGAANRSSLRVISRNDLKRSARRGQTFSFTIADIANCMGWFRNGDTIRLSLPRINQAFSVRIMVRSWDSDSGLMTCSGYAN